MSQISHRKTPGKNPLHRRSAPLAKLTSKTVHWDELEHWQRDNEYILYGYRRLQHNWRGCFSSVFAYLHNETINIHSHLWGAVLFGYFLATYYQNYVVLHAMSAWQDVAVIGIFLASAIICLVGSAFYHTSGCHSQAVTSYCHAYDYSGIIILIVGSFFPSIYYGFYCDPHIQKFYLTAMGLAGLGAAYIVLNPEYAKPTHRGARTTVFIALGLGAVIPVSHMFLTHDFGQLLREMGVGWLILSGALYIFGALLYANRIPERFAPGRFDYFFASHQIFHICVVLAALAHYEGVLSCLRYRMSQPVCGH
ncbi:HlyIII-domain-containing protein [Pholiota conissans]|uniref:HlyIII-domain-containing protein n=1 Tax=Pholiota conissans TaxID=109636 RepID=A0A9P5ZFQ3_9AGAR|nr:HlyIII-domain-containing protein [Pholiota conissans]